MKRIYISGKITGLKQQEYVSKFSKAEYSLRNAGFIPINPVEITRNIKSNSSWETYMKTCISELVFCDAIYLLPCFYHSNGAIMEIQIAKELNIPIVTDINKLFELWH